MNPNQFPDIYSTAISAAIKASELILEVYSTAVKPDYKEDGSPVTIADIQSSKIIEKALQLSSIPITGEELEISNYETRKNWDESWSVDPLDGTKMFLLKNGEFSVNIAHIKEGIPVFGIIADPVNKEVLFGGGDLGVFICSFDQFENNTDWNKLAPKEINNPLVIACSRSFKSNAHEMVDVLEKQFGQITFLRKGSALKFFDLAKGDADIYLRSGPTMEWDIAAGQAILESLGGDVIDSATLQPLSYNKESLYNPPFIARTKAMKLT